MLAQNGGPTYGGGDGDNGKHGNESSTTSWSSKDDITNSAPSRPVMSHVSQSVSSGTRHFNNTVQRADKNNT